MDGKCSLHEEEMVNLKKGKERKEMEKKEGGRKDKEGIS
jgi:hypothetical protein